jgi:hypothetical protein
MLVVNEAAAIGFDGRSALQWGLYMMQLSPEDGRMASGGLVPRTIPRHGLELVWVVTVQFLHRVAGRLTMAPGDSAAPQQEAVVVGPPWNTGPSCGF